MRIVVAAALAAAVAVAGAVATGPAAAFPKGYDTSGKTHWVKCGKKKIGADPDRFIRWYIRLGCFGGATEAEAGD